MVEAAFFDLDKTIIAGSSTLAFGRPLYNAGFVGRRTLLRLGIGQLSYMMFGADEDSLERARDEMLDLVSGWYRSEIETLIKEMLDDVIAPLVYAEALFLIDEHKRAGRKVYVVSASPEEFVRPIARMVGIDDVIATRIRTDAMGRYVPELEQYVMGPGKTEAMAREAEAAGIDMAASFAYTDSVTDIPMLEAVGNPVVVNPETELREEAESRDWPIIEFQRPVSLEPTVQAPPPRVWIPFAIGAAAAVAAIALTRKREES